MIVPNTSAPTLLDDPYPTYAALRRLARALWDSERGVWIVAGYDDVRNAFTDPRLSSAASRREGQGLHPLPRALLSRQLETTDPPDHSRMRIQIERALVSILRSDLEADVVGAISGALDRVLRETTVDVVADFAARVASGVMARVMGLPSGPNSELARAAHALMSVLGPSDGQLSNASPALLADAMARLNVAAAAAAAGPNRGSLVSLLYDRTGSRLTREELTANLLLIFAAGQGTTTSLISSCVFSLLAEPLELRRLREDPFLIGSAIEEVLRLQSPIQSVSRTAVAPTTIGDVQVEPGHEVVLLIGSANRDERQFTLPDRLDVARRPNRHLAFGRGRHLCLGAALARLQARIAVPMFLNRLDAPRLVDNGASWLQTPNTRGLAHLWVEQGSSAPIRAAR